MPADIKTPENSLRIIPAADILRFPKAFTWAQEKNRRQATLGWMPILLLPISATQFSFGISPVKFCIKKTPGAVCVSDAALVVEPTHTAPRSRARKNLWGLRPHVPPTLHRVGRPTIRTGKRNSWGLLPHVCCLLPRRRLLARLRLTRRWHASSASRSGRACMGGCPQWA